MENTGQTAFGDASIGAILRFSQWKAGSFDHFSNFFELGSFNRLYICISAAEGGLGLQLSCEVSGVNNTHIYAFRL
ncbi:hypothetical protein [Adlercreutzia sp. ZJ154]|uniref:hypothetical protein n=1 Tax=Adlercreutzia sp. ZJ154 TaxID=2709790 RepID=UPI0013ED8444|nr:hypothetical protein [Adlercreutzia sp. ZJ154]